jgi:hypothetical protein
MASCLSGLFHSAAKTRIFLFADEEDDHDNEQDEHDHLPVAAEKRQTAGPVSPERGKTFFQPAVSDILTWFFRKSGKRRRRRYRKRKDHCDHVKSRSVMIPKLRTFRCICMKRISLKKSG